MAQPSHIYGGARIHALELKLLDNAKIERMVDAATPEEVLKVLAESGDYGASMGDIQGPWEYERLLADEKKRLVDLMEQLSPDPDLTDLFFIRNDIHNLKVLLKAHYLGRNYDEFLSGAGRIETDRLKAALEEDAHRQLPAWLADASRWTSNGGQLFAQSPATCFEASACERLVGQGVVDAAPADLPIRALGHRWLRRSAA